MVAGACYGFVGAIDFHVDLVVVVIIVVDDLADAAAVGADLRGVDALKAFVAVARYYLHRLHHDVVAVPVTFDDCDVVILKINKRAISTIFYV